MQLIAGLGNPGEKYQDNPHNIGFRTLDQLMKALDLEGFQRRFNSEFQRTLENGQVTLMLKPETYMNRSGEAIAECARYFKIPSEKILTSPTASFFPNLKIWHSPKRSWSASGFRTKWMLRLVVLPEAMVNDSRMLYRVPRAFLARKMRV